MEENDGWSFAGDERDALRLQLIRRSELVGQKKRLIYCHGGGGRP